MSASLAGPDGRKVAPMTGTTTTALPLVPGRWTLDAAHSVVAFSIKRLGLAKVKGTFTDVAAEVVVGETLAATEVTATIALASVDTGNTDRDNHLRSPDLIDVAVRPTMTFRSTGITGDGEDYAVDGELTIGAVTRPVTLDVELSGVTVFPGDGREHAGFAATTEVRRKDFDLGFGPMGAMLGDVVKVEIDLELVAP